MVGGHESAFIKCPWVDDRSNESEINYAQLSTYLPLQARE